MVDLRRALVFAVEVEAVEAALGPDSDSFEAVEGRTVDKEREEGMMEAREDLLEAMLGNMTRGSGQFRSKSKPQSCRSTRQRQQLCNCNMQKWIWTENDETASDL